MRPARLMVLAAAGLSFTPASASMTLGVNTHFDQGWPISAFAKVKDAHAQSIRDVVAWGKVERAPGVYSFTDQNSGHVAFACSRHIPVLLMAAPRSPLYGDRAIYSAPGRAAFARFVAALADRFPCVVGVEVGNEINGLARNGPPPFELPAAYVATLKLVRDALHPRHPDVALVGGSSLSVAIGFLDTLFAAGMLPLVDAIAVHPYADIPEQLPLQFQRLNEAMARYGPVRPIWATEFGLYYKTLEAAPPHAIKVVTVMSAARVSQAHWYALLDEKWFPNMGLFAAGAPKPALAMFRLAQRLLAAGDAHRIDAGDPLTFVYQFGTGPSVMWGSGRAIRFGAGATVRDARDRPIPAPATLDSDPIVVDPGTRYQLSTIPVLADTFYDYGRAPWSIALRTGSGETRPMRWIDSRWASSIGLPSNPAFKATPTTMTVGGAQASPPLLVERYTTPLARTIWISACFEPGRVGAATVGISHAGHDLYAGAIDGTRQPPLLAVPLAAGEGIEIRYRATAPGQALFRRRVRILTSEASGPALCAPVASGAAP